MTKSVLNELCIKKKWLSPKYTTTKYGPDHIPAFHSTVMVNGTTFASESTARSSKQSKHDVARIAVRELMAAAAAAPVPQPSSGIENMYKSKLQIYAQKRNLLLPEYDAEQYGPPHVSQFRCSVTVDRQTYWSEGLSPTVKDAEQSAAKVALQALHPEGNEEEDLMYKSMLKEKIQKKGGCRPSYMTWKTDRVHLPTFLSTVEVEGVAFMGGEARTKKLAQMSAAKFAYTQLMEGTDPMIPRCLNLTCTTLVCACLNAL